MINTIETGYKPEFALGALYQGQNAANAQSANTEDLIRAFLANQHDIQNNPTIEARNRADLVSSQYGAARDQAKMDDPQFIPQLLAGEKGQQQVTEASGESAKALLPFKIALAKAVASGELDEAQLKGLLAKFNLDAAQPQGQTPAPEASIPEGFSMPNPGVSNAGRNAFFPQGVAQPEGVIGPIKTEAAMKASMGTGYNNETATPDYFSQIDKAIAQAKDPKALAILQAERANMGTPQAPVFSNMSVPASPPVQVANNSDRENVMKIMMDTPEFRQKQSLSKQAQDAAAAKAAANAAAMQHIAELRAKNTQGKPPTTAEAAKTQMILNDPNLDDYTKSQLLNEIMNAKSVGKSAEGQQFGITMDGKQVVPGMQQTIPPITGTLGSQSSVEQKEKTINGVPYVKVPGGWKKK